MNTSPPPLISICNATVMRGERIALDNLSLDIAQGENVAILGPNGSGKSSLLKLINRQIYHVVKPESSVEILGSDRVDTQALRKHIGQVSQDLQQGYNDQVPGLELVISGFFDSNSLWQHHVISDEHIAQAKSLMAEMAIEHLRRVRFGHLSTGQQRRLLLARALVHKPSTLILDEPTTGLDVQGTQHYLATLDKLLNQQQTAILLVTHHLHEIPAQIDRVVLLKEGKVVFDGEKAEALAEDRLSKLFGLPLRVSCQNGIYNALPVNSA